MHAAGSPGAGAATAVLLSGAALLAVTACAAKQGHCTGRWDAGAFTNSRSHCAFVITFPHGRSLETCTVQAAGLQHQQEQVPPSPIASRSTNTGQDMQANGSVSFSYMAQDGAGGLTGGWPRARAAKLAHTDCTTRGHVWQPSRFQARRSPGFHTAMQ